MHKVAVVGSFVADLMAMAPRLPTRGETVMGQLFRTGAGGKGFNQAIAARLAGANITFSTRLGRDSFAQLALETMERVGLSTEHLLWSDEEPTGAALICVDSQGGGNQIVVVPGACGRFSEAEIDSLSGLVAPCSYLLLQLEIDMHAVERLAMAAAAQGVRVILNPAPAQEISPALYRSLFLITPNEVETASLTGITCHSLEDCRAAARVFFERGVERVAITLGSAGVYCSDGEQDALFPNWDVPVVDTTGAGDAFNGGLLAGLGKGMPFFEAVQYGEAAANLSVGKMGTAVSMPEEKEIEALLQSGTLLGGEIAELQE